MSDDFFHPTFDRGEFRYAVARYVKLLIRARWKSDAGFLSRQELEKWTLTNIDQDRYPAHQLLHQAAIALAFLNHEYLPRCGSGGVALTSDETPEGRLIWEVSTLVQTEGGGPYHNLALLKAANQIENGLKVTWCELVEWSRICAIRTDLDLLPHPCAKHVTQSQDPKPAGSSREGNIFQYEGATWTVSYKTKTIPQRNSVGIFYISQLLNCPNKPMPSSTLRGLYAAWSNDSSTTLRKHAANATLSIHGNQADAIESGDNLHPISADLGSVMTESMREHYERRVAELQPMISSLRSKGMKAQADEHQEELAALQDALRQAHGLRGKARKQSQVTKKNRDAVCNAVKRALTRLAKDHPALYRHLKQSLHLGSTCCYAPEESVEWNV